MKLRKELLIGSLGLLMAINVNGQETSEDPVLNLMVRKGLVSQQDADKAKAEEKQIQEGHPASRITLQDPSVQKLQFYGDGRLRFESISQQFHYAGNTIVDRERYRLRFGLIYSYADNLTAGFELRSGTADDTANQTMGGMFTDASINVGKIYLQYKPADWATLVAGKFQQPLYTTTDMTWSNDLTPEGGAEVLSFTFPLGGGSSTSTRDPKDAKSVITSTKGSDSSLTVGLTAAQYIYVNNNESNNAAPFSSNNNDVFIIANQIPITWKINDDITAKVVPGFTFYTGGGNTNYDSGVPVNYNNTGTPAAPTYVYGTANSSNDPVFTSPNEADDLNILSAPGEIDYNIAKIPFRTYWDFDWNVTARQRIQDVYLGPGATFATVPTGAASPSVATAYGFSPTGGMTQAHARAQNQNLTDGVAWAIGEQIGQNKKRGDWSILGEFRQVGLGSVDPNINGTDFANSYLNQQGFKLAAAYNITDFLTGSVTYYNTWDYKDGLYKDLNGSGAKAAVGTTQYLIGQNTSQRIQVDLGWKF